MIDGLFSRSPISLYFNNVIFSHAGVDNSLVISIIGHRGAVLLRTDTVFPVPVQLEPWWTGTLIAAQRVDASVFAASTIYAAFINIYERRRDVWWNNSQANSLNSILLSSNTNV